MPSDISQLECQKRVRFSDRLAARAPARMLFSSVLIPRRSARSVRALAAGRRVSRRTSSQVSGRLSSAAKARKTGAIIRAQGRVAREPCQACLDEFEECLVGENSARCAYCAEHKRTVAECGVDVSLYDEVPGVFS